MERERETGKNLTDLRNLRGIKVSAWVSSFSSAWFIHSLLACLIHACIHACIHSGHANPEHTLTHTHTQRNLHLGCSCSQSPQDNPHQLHNADGPMAQFGIGLVRSCRYGQLRQLVLPLAMYPTSPSSSPSPYHELLHLFQEETWNKATQIESCLAFRIQYVLSCVVCVLFCVLCVSCSYSVFRIPYLSNVPMLTSMESRERRNAIKYVWHIAILISQFILCSTRAKRCYPCFFAYPIEVVASHSSATNNKLLVIGPQTHPQTPLRFPAGAHCIYNFNLY